MANFKAEDCKKSGNDCMKAEKFVEAMLHYTQAIKLEPRNHLLYSNRSLAFLKMEQYYHAWDDARKVIRLQPDWPKGYFRKGEAEFKAEHYKEALQSFKQGLSIEPNDTGLQDVAVKASAKLKEQRKEENRIPWIGIGGGVAFGLMIVIGDEVFAQKPIIQHMLLKLSLIAALTLLGYGISRAYLYLIHQQRAAMLEEPLQLFPEEDAAFEAAEAEHQQNREDPGRKVRHRGGAAAGKHRHKKGKS